MIKSVKVTNYLGESQTFELAFPERSGFNVKKITGLGPPKATINATEISTNDGSLFNSSRVGNRNIVLTLVFVSETSIEDVRLESYKLFPVKKRVRLDIETDNRKAYTYGYVESNPPEIFSKSESTQVSIICPDPYFYSEQNELTIFYGIEPMFEFPFSNEDLQRPLLVMGEIRNFTEQTVHYDGDAEVGVILRLHAIGNVVNPTIYNINTREKMRIDTDKLKKLTGQGIIAGDDITISTVKGDKYITLTRGGINYNILNTLDKNASWFQLAKGDNIFAYTADDGRNNIQFSIENKIVFEGV